MTSALPLRAALSLALSALLSHCAETQSASATSPTTLPQRRMRAAPGARATERALAPALSQARACLGPQAPAARLTGAFTGSTGAFALTQSTDLRGAPLAPALRACIASAFAQVTVRPFTSQSFEITRDLAIAIAPVSPPTAAPTRQPLAQPSAQPVVVATPIEAILQLGQTGFASCFNRHSEHAPELEGRIELRFTLSRDGRILQAAHRVLSETHGHGQMAHVAQCAEDHLRTLTFGARTQDAEFHVVPLSFNARELFAPQDD
ncbi:MAG: hypothetical protein Q8Q09_10215 [Deltaproteobacteria bacterium]|nr:hypothetical protein [Deltaproteobacteria bacterium]